MSEIHQETHKEGWDVLAAYDETAPVFMMNDLDYKERVPASGKSGKETHKEYLKSSIYF